MRNIRLLLLPIPAFALAACSPATERPAPEPTLTVLAPPALEGFAQAADPTIAVDPATGELLFAFAADAGDGRWDLYFSRTAGAPGALDTPVRVNDQPGTVLPHAEGSPRMVAAPGVVALIWNNGMRAEGRRFGASDLLFSRSTDGGASWSPAIALQDPIRIEGLPPRANTFHGAAWDGDQGLIVTWLDGRERDQRRLDRAVAAGETLAEAARRPEQYEDPSDPHDGDATIYAAFSPDLGASWEPQNRRLADTVCPCCRISLVPVPGGGIVGGWRQNFPGSVRDPVIGPIPGLGNGVGPAQVTRVHEDGWVFPGCPHSGPGLVADAGGTLHVTWYTGVPERMGIWYAQLPAGASGFTSPLPVLRGDALGVAHPAIVLLPGGGSLVASNVAADGRRVIVLTRLDATGKPGFSLEVPDSRGATHPQLAVLSDDSVLVAWTESRDGIERVRLAQLELALAR
ncbi:MAG: hypothetical protein JJT85_10705 [Chromatiales bacterium]|nr:hypothetical protein [Chromatiales bacterium]